MAGNFSLAPDFPFRPPSASSKYRTSHYVTRHVIELERPPGRAIELADDYLQQIAPLQLSTGDHRRVRIKVNMFAAKVSEPQVPLLHRALSGFYLDLFLRLLFNPSAQKRQELVSEDLRAIEDSLAPVPGAEALPPAGLPSQAQSEVSSPPAPQLAAHQENSRPPRSFPTPGNERSQNSTSNKRPLQDIVEQNGHEFPGHKKLRQHPGSTGASSHPGHIKAPEDVKFVGAPSPSEHLHCAQREPFAGPSNTVGKADVDGPRPPGQAISNRITEFPVETRDSNAPRNPTESLVIRELIDQEKSSMSKATRPLYAENDCQVTTNLEDSDKNHARTKIGFKIPAASSTKKESAPAKVKGMLLQACVCVINGHLCGFKN
ncbi:hypothetical protein IWX90DRAFT_415364 [Phyllosticta citrichinensis]|uniref:Uncharacterized protein n=1 Tax=Phyllosticta citrichinensis TaxID=1130410 RepID=A0ABR1XUS3_9PEZI